MKIEETYDQEGYTVPPWIKFPDIKLGSIGWKMGAEEQYIEENSVLFCKQIRKVQVEIMKKYPEPEGWQGFYKSIK